MTDNKIKSSIEWHDSSEEFDQEMDSSLKDKHRSDDEFTSLLKEEGEVVLKKTPRLGEKVQAFIISLNDRGDDILLDCGSKEPASISKKDLCDDKGVLKYRVGDTIEAFVISVSNGEITLSNSLSHKIAQENSLRTAYENRVPVKGKVGSLNKGGYNIILMGKSAFCPISQIDQNYVEHPGVFVGKQFDFLIQDFSQSKIVVSRALLQKEKALTIIKKLEERLEEEDKIIVEGVVVQLKEPFGALVDVGGVIGFLHVSQVRYGHCDNIADVLSVGQKIRVCLLAVEESRKGLAPRVSLSMKSVDPDPWHTIHESYEVGESYQGKVVKYAKFGAFIELAEGVEGLLHLSEMSWTKKINKAEDVLKIGDMVRIRLLNIDQDKKRLSLTLKAIDDDPWAKITFEYPKGTEHEGKIERLKNFGAIVELKEGVTGLLPTGTLKKAFGHSYRKKSSPPNILAVKISEIDQQNRKILLTLPNLDEDEEVSKDYQEYLKSTAEKEASKTSETTDNSSYIGSFGELLASRISKKD